MVAARERPNVAVKVGKKLDDDGFGGLRDEIALGDFELVTVQRASFWKELVASAGSEYQEVGGAPFAFDRIARLFSVRVHGHDVRAMHSATGALRAFEKQAIQNRSRVD